MKILFLHGKESKPEGAKATFLKEAGHTILNPHLPKDDWEGSVEIATSLWKKEKPDVVVGSSRGAAVAMSVGEYVKKMILVAPAWKRFCGEDISVADKTVILHSDKDKIVPYANSCEIADRFRAMLVTVGAGHRMSDSVALERLLQEVEA